MKQEFFHYKKSSKAAWLLLGAALFFIWFFVLDPCYWTLNRYPWKHYLIFLIFINGMFMSFFWFSGLKDVVVFIVYQFIRKPELKLEKKIIQKWLPENWHPKVLLLYATCNDFIPSALKASMQQTYDNVQTVILDDSQNKKYINQVNHFQMNHPEVCVVRRTHHVGFKAGNLNHFLKQYHDYDYFVLLDSDEVIPHDFTTKALHYFAANPRLGILQCTHDSNRNENWFMREFSRSVQTFWKIYNTYKLKYGYAAMYGHGAMISRQDYETTNGFPEIVAEDLSFSLESTFRGFEIGFSNLILCHEQFPVNYLAFKKRQIKWTSGNWQFIEKYTHKLIHSKALHWYEKLDLFVFVYSLSIYALMYGSFIICTVLFPLIDVKIINMPLWTIIPVIYCFFAQTINDVFVQIKQHFPWYKLPFYVLSGMVLYGSMYWIVLKVTIFMMLHLQKAKFIVTPKFNQKYTLKDAIKINWGIVIFGVINICY